MALRHPIHWLREHPQAADWLLAGAIAAIAVIFHLTYRDSVVARPSLLGVVLTLGATLPLARRRQAPATVLIVVTLCQMWMEAMNAAGPGWMGVLVAAYTLGAYRNGSLLWRLGGVLVVSVIAFVIAGVLHGDAPWQALVSTPIVFASAIVVGDNVRRRRERSAELVERAERAERERLLLAHQHVQDERTRIARELHDVVAHSVSLMVIQTAAARRQLLHTDPVGVDASLATVEATGRLAMQEMRRILGVLRDASGEASLVPQPGLAAIDGLAANADLPVSVRSEGDLQHLPAGVELSAYRIVQEALTNVRRHAGPVHHVDVAMVRANGSLMVEVSDDGRGAANFVEGRGADGRGGEGFGLIGMRERVAAFDGDLHAGPRPGGGWRVRAIFPIGTR